MLSLFKKDKPGPQPTIRDTLFSDEPLEKVATYSKEPNDTSCWSHFTHAQQILKNGNKSEAVNELNKVLEITGLESRVYLQAWNCLRELGNSPSTDIANQIRGIVVEVALDKGLDLVAAYSDHSARYYNFSGAAVVWDASDPNIEKIIDELLAAGQVIINNIGLWEKPRPPAPSKGSVRINLLTYGGLYFGQGKFEMLAQDKLAAPAIKGATSLMQVLIAKNAAEQSVHWTAGEAAHFGIDFGPAASNANRWVASKLPIKDITLIKERIQHQVCLNSHLAKSILGPSR